MKRFFVFLGIITSMIGSAVRAQEVDSTAPLQKSSWGDAKTEEIIDYVPEISLDTRFGYDRYIAERGHFKGDGLYLNIDGYISPHLSYSLQQRLASSYYEDNTGFNGTNWLTLTYEVGQFEFSAGKLGTLAGGFENDYDDFDSYYDMNSMFYNMLDSYHWGVGVTWYPAGNHSLTLLSLNSPLQNGDRFLMGHDLAWSFESEIYEALWEVNLWEYAPGKFVKGLNLGNRFNFGGFSIDLDYMTRAANGLKGMFQDDFGLIARPSYTIIDRICIFGKCGWEHTESELPYSLAYEELMGGDYLFYGAGIEFYPIKEYDKLRVHAAWTGTNAGDNWLNIGLKWRFDLTSAAKQLFSK